MTETLEKIEELIGSETFTYQEVMVMLMKDIIEEDDAACDNPSACTCSSSCGSNYSRGGGCVCSSNCGTNYSQG